MTDIEALGNAVLRGKEITREEALALYAAPLEPLAKKADEIRARFCGNTFDLCAILNAKSGRCPENCKFCAQSARYATGAEEYPLLRTEEIVHAAKLHAAQGVPRYSLVTSGRRLTDEEVEKICEAARAIRQETNLSVCVSCGLLNEAQFRALKEAGHIPRAQQPGNFAPQLSQHLHHAYLRGQNCRHPGSASCRTYRVQRRTHGAG